MTGTPDPILLYHPDAYQVARADLKGRHSAGESFITAFLDQCPGPDVYALCATSDHFAEFSRAVEGAGRDLVPRQVSRTGVGLLRERGLLNLPHPEVVREASLRSFVGNTAYAVCGVTHTVASEAMIAGLTDIVTGPVMPWDAIVCTSRAVHAAVQAVVAQAEDNLRGRLGATRFVRPLLPIIPLGVHASRFAPKDDDRKRWRTKLGIDDDTFAILFFGRLSVHGKASPFQLAQAAEMAARRAAKKFVVIWAGRFANDFQRQTFMVTAQSMAPSVPFHHVDGAEADAVTVWSAADVFCSMSDNIQESFGLTIIEAMAAGLPVLASNWDGYRDTVEHGVSGFLVDTVMPAASLADAAYRYLAGVDTYDRFIGGISQVCVVNVAQLAHGLERIAADPDLRRRLGEAGRRAVETKFEWSVVLPRYHELWREQLERLTHARAETTEQGAMSWKGYDPAAVFSSYPSHRLTETSLLEKGPHFDAFATLIDMPGVIANPGVLLRDEELLMLHAAFGPGEPLAIKALLKPLVPHKRRFALRTLHWMVKIGALRIRPALADS
jgi:glycosyltransferase involved in cell wall biosynthesis